MTLGEHVLLNAVPPDQGNADNTVIDEADIVFYDVADAPLPDPLPEKHLVVFDPHRLPDSPAFPSRKPAISSVRA